MSHKNYVYQGCWQSSESFHLVEFISTVHLEKSYTNCAKLFYTNILYLNYFINTSIIYILLYKIIKHFYDIVKYGLLISMYCIASSLQIL